MPKKKIIEIIHNKGKSVKSIKTKSANKTVKGTNGGKRAGAGRKPGSKESPLVKWERKAFTDYLTEKRVRRMIDKIIEAAEDGDITASKYILDHTFGKAVQTIQGNEEKPVMISIDI